MTLYHSVTQTDLQYAEDQENHIDGMGNAACVLDLVGDSNGDDEL